MVRQQGVRQTNQHMLFTGKYRFEKQCLSKEIGVIPCWRRSQLNKEVIQINKGIECNWTRPLGA